MEVIYADILAAINFGVDYLLLAATIRLAGIPLIRRRIAGGAGLGAFYAVLTILPIGTFAGSLPIKAAAGLGMVRIACGKRSARQTMKLFLLFLLVAFGFGGCTSAFYFMTGTCLTQNGVYYLEVPLPIVLSACILAYVLSGLLFQGQAKHGAIQDSVEQVSITAFGKQQEFRLLLDTGNDLTDPMSGKPVIILERESMTKLFPVELQFLTEVSEADASALFYRIPRQYRSTFSLLPYTAVGTSGGLLLAFRPQKIERQGRRYEALAAISPQKIARGRYEGLIGL